MRSRSRKKSNPRLLLIEQDPRVIDEIRALFANPGLECEVALSVETAMKILGERRMDAVLVDAAVDSLSDGMAGLVRQLKGEDKAMKIVIFNGTARKTAQRKLRRHGVDGYLRARSSHGMLTRSVRRALGLE